MTLMSMIKMMMVVTMVAGVVIVMLMLLLSLLCSGFYPCNGANPCSGVIGGLPQRSISCVFLKDFSDNICNICEHYVVFNL